MFPLEAPAPVPAVVPAAAEPQAHDGNWLQVQVNLDNRNLLQPRVRKPANPGECRMNSNFNVL